MAYISNFWVSPEQITKKGKFDGTHISQNGTF
jgi:hypothetical protein